MCEMETMPIRSPINNRVEFIAFLRQLIVEQQAGEFANNTLPDYLAALASFAEDYDGFCVRLADAPSPEIASWQAFADMLAAEVVYE